MRFTLLIVPYLRGFHTIFFVGKIDLYELQDTDWGSTQLTILKTYYNLLCSLLYILCQNSNKMYKTLFFSQQNVQKTFFFFFFRWVIFIVCLIVNLKYGSRDPRRTTWQYWICFQNYFGSKTRVGMLELELSVRSHQPPIDF